MPVYKRLLVVMLAVLLCPLVNAQMRPSNSDNAKDKHSTISPQQAALDRTIDSIIARERNEVAALALYRPIVETYVQELKPDKEMSFQPYHDAYFLGQADLSRGIALRSMLSGKKNPLAALIGSTDSGYIPEGFLQMVYVDRNHFDKENYEFHYAGREFLGEVRCLMFDIQPSRRSRGDHFSGRIWVEDRDYTIVRFNGVYLPRRTFDGQKAHFDSWRLNVQPDLWLPSYIFSEEVKPRAELPRFKAQTRFWAYKAKNANREAEFSDLFVDPAGGVDDTTHEQHDRSPLEAEREFEREAEENTVEILSRSGLIAPGGEVEKVLDTVLTNLEVTNNLSIEPEPHCRVMLTSNIELFSVGHTIVLSRGLLDVLPDEATLASMLAQELSDAMILRPGITQYAFSDVLQTKSSEALRQLSFKSSREDWEATGRKANELLANSPYRSRLSTAGLFFQELNVESKRLPHLISPNIGNRIYPLASVASSSVSLQPGKVDQIAALPMGSRIKMNPWTDEIEMMKAKQAPLRSAREKMPFEVTPFAPYLTRYSNPEPPKNTAAAESSSQSQPTSN